mmetsp:Transcript_9774/g.24344  ORF Transcript_9774/g.24344 Transcript_9774/m.24344 type:complete len:145 (-) Transcript_9774:998-1432(-)
MIASIQGPTFRLATAAKIVGGSFTMVIRMLILVNQKPLGLKLQALRLQTILIFLPLLGFRGGPLVARLFNYTSRMTKINSIVISTWETESAMRYLTNQVMSMTGGTVVQLLVSDPVVVKVVFKACLKIPMFPGSVFRLAKTLKW